METSGRERRHRYFTVANYLQLIVEEQLDNAPPMGSEAVNLETVGGFLQVSEDQFYETEQDLVSYVHHFKDNDVPNGRKTPKNPVLPDGTVKRGRPRKTGSKSVVDTPNGGTKPPQKGKRKRKETSVIMTEETPASITAENHGGRVTKKARSTPVPPEAESSTGVAYLLPLH